MEIVMNKKIFIILGLVCLFSSCAHRKYIKYSWSQLEKHKDANYFKEFKRNGLLRINSTDSIIDIVINKNTLVFFNNYNNSYSIFLYSKNMAYINYLCDSNLNVTRVYVSYGKKYYNKTRTSKIKR